MWLDEKEASRICWEMWLDKETREGGKDGTVDIETIGI